MPDKTTRLTILIDHPTKQKLETLSETVDLTVSQILRKLIRNHLQEYEEQTNPAPPPHVSEDSATYT